MRQWKRWNLKKRKTWRLKDNLRKKEIQNIKMGHSWPPFQLFFGHFQTKINTILEQINGEKCPSSIWCWDSNPRHSGHESPTITTRAR